MSLFGNPQLSDGSRYLSLIADMIVEMILFAASELFVRQFFPPTDYNGTWISGRVRLLIIQEAILLALTLGLLTFHHTPFILIMLFVVILVKVIQLALSTEAEQFEPYLAQKVSKPLRNNTSKRGFQQQLGRTPHVNSHPYRQPGYAGLSSTNHNNDAGLRKRLTYDPTSIGSPQQTLLKESSSYSTTSSSHVSVGQVSSDSQMSLNERSSIIAPRRPIANSESSIQRNSSLSGAMQSKSAMPLSIAANIPHSTFNLYSQREKDLKYLVKPSTTPPGLLNNGNTCFVNATFQCLNWTPEFIKLLPQKIEKSSQESMFLSKLNEMFLKCNVVPDNKTIFEPISTTNLLSSISLLAPHLVSPANSIQYQQDTAEFLLWLLNHLHTALRSQSNGELGIHKDYTESQLNDKEKTKKACMKEINKIGSDNLAALKDPMISLSKVDWDLHWQKHSSTLYELFLGQILEARECQECKKVTMNIEYFTLLPLPIPRGVKEGCTLRDCLNKFSEREDLVQDNMITCSCVSEDSLVPATRLALLSTMPKSLIIQLTRFSYNSSLRSAIKNDSLISFPLEMDFFPHTMKAMLSHEGKESMVYQLHAFCVHSGAQSTSFGHYMAFCEAADQEWYHFNDQHVTHISDIDAALNSDFVLRNAYLLFYHSV